MMNKSKKKLRKNRNIPGLDENENNTIKPPEYIKCSSKKKI